MPIKILERVRIPILDIELPNIELPDIPPKIPKLDDREREILRYAIMDDIADIIPVVGDIASDIAHAELKRLMRPDEYDEFIQANKWLPSSLAVLKIFSERKG